MAHVVVGREVGLHALDLFLGCTDSSVLCKIAGGGARPGPGRGGRQQNGNYGTAGTGTGGNRSGGARRQNNNESQNDREAPSANDLDADLDAYLAARKKDSDS